VVISLGNAEKLSVFLDKFPDFPRENALVDSYEGEAYKAVGFTTFLENIKRVPRELVSNVRKPNLTRKQWWEYMKTVGKVAPFDNPQGALIVGGTYVLDGDKVVWAWADPVPGQHPDISTVLCEGGIN